MVRSLRCVMIYPPTGLSFDLYAKDASTSKTPRYVSVPPALTAYLPLGLIHRALLTLVDDVPELSLILINIYIEVSLNVDIVDVS